MKIAKETNYLFLFEINKLTLTLNYSTIMGSFEMHRFRSIDRTLTTEEQKEINTWSSRFSPNSTGITYIYHYGSFKKDPNKIFHQYFDAMLYVSSYGTKQLMFRFPKDMVNFSELLRFEVGTKWEAHLKFDRKGDYIVMDLYWNEEEGGGWIEEEDYELDPLLPLREEILKGDYRALYMAWMMVMEKMGGTGEEDDDYDEEDDLCYDEDDDVYEKLGEESSRKAPPIPPNMQQSTAAHKELIRVFEINKHLVSGVATVSPNAAQNTIDYAALIQQLSNQEKEAFLLQLVKGRPRVDLSLKKHLSTLGGVDAIQARRKILTWQEILKFGVAAENKTNAAFKVEQKRLHIEKMKRLINQKASLWAEVERNILKAQGKSYDTATETLCDLKAVAEYEKKVGTFEKKLDNLLMEFGGRSALMRRWQAKGLRTKIAK